MELKKFIPTFVKMFDFNIIYIFLILFLFNIPFIFNYSYAGDSMAYFVPHYHYITDSLRKGDIPYWFPYSFSGLPEIFKPELAIFNPMTILLIATNLIFNQNMDISLTGNLREVVNMLTQFFGAVGMYCLLKKHFFKSRITNLFLSVLFVLSPFAGHFANTTVILGFVLLPWVVLFLMNFIYENTRTQFFVLVLFNFLLLTSGYIYYYVYFLIFQLLICVFLNYKKIFYVFFSYFLAVGIALFFLIPNYHVISNSSRSENITNHKIYSLKFTKLIQLVNPLPNGFSDSQLDPNDYWTRPVVTLGSSCFFILLIGFLYIKKERKYYALIFALILFLIYSMIGYLFPSEAINSIPVINKFRSHAQGFIISYFCMVVLAGRGLEYLEEKGSNFNFSNIINLFFTISIITSIFLINKNNDTEVLYSWIRALSILGVSIVLIFWISRKFLLGTVLLFLLAIVEYFFVYSRFEEHVLVKWSYNDFFTRNSLVLPDMRDNDNIRVYFSNNQFAYNTANLKIHQFVGYEALPYKSWYDFGYRYGPLDHLKKLNVKYIVTTEKSYSEKENFKLIKTISPWEKPGQKFISSINGLSYLSPESKNIHYIYEVLDYTPRFFATRELIPCEGSFCLREEDFPHKLSYSGSESRNFTLENEVGINLVSKKSSQIELEVESKYVNFIGSSENFDSGWEIFINGKKSELYRISTGFIGFFVEPGKNNVILRYYPSGLNLGILLSLISIILNTFIFFRWDFIQNKFKYLQKRLFLFK